MEHSRHISGIDEHAAESANASGCGLAFYIDATISNRANPNSNLASQQVNFINLNGSYTATFKAKCAAAGSA